MSYLQTPEQFRHPMQMGPVLVPGIPVLAANTERFPVPPTGSRAVELRAGDEFAVVDDEGKQRAEIVFFTPDGRSDTGVFNSTSAKVSRHVATGLQSVLDSDDASAKRVRNALAQSGFDIGAANAVSVFGPESRSGDTAEFVADRDGLLIVCAPGEPMRPDEQNTNTSLSLYVKRAQSADENAFQGIADPLADPLQDINIQPGEAKAYEVKAGQFIQILDVQGRECSDFQALSLAGLDNNKELLIDPTTTRSLMGLGYPAPGLYAKYWSMEQKPMVEIVQDTCGRHDTFGLACTARYYDDLGYPGHVNCSDNMNISLGKYNVRPRAGWPAINFFFNTMIDDTNAIGMDDPWSRPGDYVLLRALDDMVCVSTACPCDVDPANGWNPTDIQVRVYDAKEDFKRSVAFRKQTDSDMTETKETGFHSSFSRFTRDFTEYNGYWLANQMNNHGAIAEYWACREKAVVMDLSPLRKYEVTGPDAEELLQLCVTRDIKKLSVGQVVYTAMCYEHGGMIDDGTVFRLGENNFRWVGGNDDSGLWMREQAEKNDMHAWVRDSTDQLCNIAVQGPLSRDILSSVIWAPPAQPSVEELGWFRLSIARLHDYEGIPVVISRTGYTGELGYEVFCHPKHASAVFDSIWKAGEPHGMLPFGLAALDMVRIEAGLIFAGYEFSDQTDPFEAGIGFTVPLKSKTDPFIGRDALQRRKDNPQKKLVGLELDGGQVPATGDCVRLGKAQIGEITSAMKSPTLGKVIALCRMDVTHSEIGSRVEVGQLDGQQKRIPATVTAFPHFDPGKERVKGNYA